MQPSIDARGHQLTVTLPPEPLPVDADPIRLSQVIGNLLDNAAKYTQRAGRICLTIGREGGEVVLRVRDHGVGMPPNCSPTSSTCSCRASGPWPARRGDWGSA